MPRLAPRISRQNAEDQGNSLFRSTELSCLSVSPVDKVENVASDVPTLSHHAPMLQHQNRKLYHRRVLSDKATSCNIAPLSPCPGSSSEPLLEPIKSPMPFDIMADASFSSDFAITPPAAGPRPLVVSAKRVGQDVRREHTKRRRASRRVAKSDSGLNLWNPTQSQESSDEDEEDLPFLFPQSEVTPGEQTKQYWEWCYGKGQKIELKPEQSWSAKRAPPAKGCLFYNKKATTPTANYKTPPVSPLKSRRRSRKQKKQVQFGLPQAAEYVIDEPPQSLTPLPSDVTRARYSMDQKEKTEVEEELTIETKQNSVLLAEWEEDFAEPRSSSRRKRKDRRSSSLFTPSPMLNYETSDGESISSTAPSPSAEIMKNLESLRMASPAAPAPLNENQDPQESSSFPTYPQPRREECTSEFGVNLEAINTTGGAMDISPPQRALPSPGDTTPPPSTVSLEAIHSVGGALGMESPASTDTLSPSAPLSMLHLCDGNDEMLLARAKSTDIVNAILENPASDQEWASADLLLNLAKTAENTLESVLASIDCKQNGVVACTDDFSAKTRYLSQNKFKLRAKNEACARKLACTELKHLEIDFINDLNKVLGAVFGKAAALSQRAKIMNLPDSSKRARKRRAAACIQREISALQESIQREQEVLDTADAAKAPYSVLQCQATFGISGFRLDEFNGETLNLSFEHVVQGFESTFVFDLAKASVKASWRNVKVSSQQPIPASHLAARFHEFFMKQLMSGSLSLLQDLQVSELQESILTLSRWLGRLDLATCGLYLAAKTCKASISVEMPVVRLGLPGGAHLHLDFEEAHGFLPSALTRFEDEVDATALEMPSEMAYHNMFQKVVGTLSS